MTRPGGRPSAARPAAVDVAAAILVFGGLFGFSQLVVGDFAITGSLPTRVPIAGVAVVLYGASVILGVSIRNRAGWLPAISLAALFAFLYFSAPGRLVNVTLGLAHLGVVGVLAVHRRWFEAAARG